MAHDVFISYSHLDKPTADAACATLESRGVRCWIAPRDVLPGDEYASALVNAIHSSRMLVLVFSSGANQSPQVLREVERAVSKGLPILPLRIEDVTPSAAMEYYISSRHWLDALTTPLEQHLVQLADTVTLLLARSPGGAAPPPPQAVKPVPAPPGEQKEAPRQEAPRTEPPRKEPPREEPPPRKEPPRAAPSSPPPRVLDPRLAGRGRIAVAGLLVLAMLGVGTRLAPQLQYMFGWSSAQVTIASLFRLLLLALGFAAGGILLRRASPRRIVTLAGLLYGIGALVAGILMPSTGSFLLYALATGLAAAGSGLGFVAVVATLLKWFPDRRGVIAGIASAAWFIGAAPAGRMFGYFGIRWLALLGLVALPVVTLAARVLHDPAPAAAGQSSLQQPLTTSPWYELWILLFANTLAGAITITALGAVATAETIVAPWLLDVLLVCQAFGCLIWGALSDRLGRRRVLLTALVVQAILLLAVPGSIRVAATPVLMVIIFLANGGGFSTIPATVADHFASDDGARYGVLLSAWCLAFLVSAALFRLVRGNPSTAFQLAAGIAFLAAVVAFRLRPSRPA